MPSWKRARRPPGEVVLEHALSRGDYGVHCALCSAVFARALHALGSLRWLAAPGDCMYFRLGDRLDAVPRLYMVARSSALSRGRADAAADERAHAPSSINSHSICCVLCTVVLKKCCGLVTGGALWLVGLGRANAPAIFLDVAFGRRCFRTRVLDNLVF